MENVVTAIFDVEAEAYKAFTEIRQQPFGKDFTVAEASLLKREGDRIIVADAFDASGKTSDDTATGVIVGSIVGILGGPLGVLLGASAGALIGSAKDSNDALDSVSMLEVTAGKLYDGETAIVALVQEEEPAFDVVFEGYKTTITRHFAVDVMKEVELARDAASDFENKLRAQLEAEKKEEREEKREERKAEVQAKFEELKAKREERKENLDEAKDIAKSEFTNSTKQMMGE